MFFILLILYISACLSHCSFLLLRVLYYFCIWNFWGQLIVCCVKTDTVVAFIDSDEMLIMFLMLIVRLMPLWALLYTKYNLVGVLHDAVTPHAELRWPEAHTRIFLTPQLYLDRSGLPQT